MQQESSSKQMEQYTSVHRIPVKTEQKKLHTDKFNSPTGRDNNYNYVCTESHHDHFCKTTTTATTTAKDGTIINTNIVQDFNISLTNRDYNKTRTPKRNKR